jgi:zinc transporter
VCIGNGDTSALHELHREITALTDISITPLTCLATLLEDMAWHLEETAYSLDESLDAIESILHDIGEASTKIAEIRQSIASIRRYVIPERDAIISLSYKMNTITDAPVSLFKEVSDSMVRESETIEMLRERASIIQDTLSNQIGALANKRMYLLTLVMLIFTPAFFVMGLFSMSLPLPGVHSTLTFWFVTLFIIIFTFGMLWILKRKKWV